MSTELQRTSFGMTDKGQVVVIEKQSYDGSGDLVSTFEVRHGVRTVGEYASSVQANAVASVLAAPVEPAPPPADPVVVEESVSVKVRRK